MTDKYDITDTIDLSKNRNLRFTLLDEFSFIDISVLILFISSCRFIIYKYNTKISVQLSASYTHVNLLDSANFKGIKHDAWAVAFVGKYKFSPQSSVLLQFNMPLTTRNFNNINTTTNGSTSTLTTTKGVLPKPDLGIGFEVSTGSHQFQIFICTADAIIKQERALYNANDFSQKQMVIGFNITRQWGF